MKPLGITDLILPFGTEKLPNLSNIASEVADTQK